MNIILTQIYLHSIKAELKNAQLALNRIKDNPNSQLNINEEIIIDNSLKTIKSDCERVQKEIK